MKIEEVLNLKLYPISSDFSRLVTEHIKTATEIKFPICGGKGRLDLFFSDYK